jgi:hypothetical protein
MKFSFDLNIKRTPLLTGLVGATLAGVAFLGVANIDTSANAATAVAGKHAAKVEVVEASAHAAKGPKKLLTGTTQGSYFWDDGSGRQGDTGTPAGGMPMQKGLFASPSWPLGTEGYVTYHGKKAKFFIGDRGPGVPSSNGVMLDIDGKTFAYLTGGTWDDSALTVTGAGGAGQITVDYVVTKWGTGPGLAGKPVPFSSGAWHN